MKKFYLAIMILLIAFFSANLAWAEKTNSISQYGITWLFDRSYEYGQFANGDYWVLGPVTITDITPKFTGKRNGWQVNPVFNQPQGFDDRVVFFESKVVPNLPYLAKPGESILKSISFPEDYKERAKLETIAILTVVGSIPPNQGADVFRPGYAGSDKTYYYTKDIRADRLLSIKTINRGVSYGQINDHFKRPQIEHKGDRAGRFIRPKKNMHSDYAPYHAGQLNNAIAKFFGTDELSKKWQSLIYVIQAGIDRYNAVLSGQTWPDGGGHQPGHKLAVAFAAYMLDNKAMKNKVSENFWYENRYVKYGLWGRRGVSEKRYWTYAAKDPGYNLEYADPYNYIDGGNNVTRRICSYQIIVGNNKKGMACWLRYLPEMKAFWSDADSFIQYAERWVSHGLKAKPDPCAPVDPADIGKKPDDWKYYGRTWGPDGKGGCIKGSGRFSDRRDGIEADTGQYQSEQMNEMWKLYKPGEVPVGDNDGSVASLKPSPPTELYIQ